MAATIQSVSTGRLTVSLGFSVMFTSLEKNTVKSKTITGDPCKILKDKCNIEDERRRKAEYFLRHLPPPL